MLPVGTSGLLVTRNFHIVVLISPRIICKQPWASC